MPHLTSRAGTAAPRLPWQRWVLYAELALASLLGACVVADLLQLMLPVALSLGVLALLIGMPWALGIAILRLPSAAWSTHLRKPVPNQALRTVFGVSQLMWADTGFALGLGAALEANRTHDSVVVGAVMIVVSLLFPLLPNSRLVWRLVCPVLLTVLCVWRYQSIGDRPAMTREQVWLLATVAGLALHTVAAMVHGAYEALPDETALPAPTAANVYPRWMPWCMGVCLLGLAALHAQPVGLVLAWLCIAWLLLRSAVELLAALPTRVSLANAEQRPSAGGRATIELTSLALVLLLAGLPREAEGFHWTRLLGFSTMVWAVRVSAQRALAPTRLLQMGGLAASLLALSWLAYVEANTMPLAVAAFALVLGATWLACTWILARASTVHY